MNFSIYIASLSHYNNGELVGKWLDIRDLNPQEIQESILDYMEELGVEEWAIHDHENLDLFYSEYGMNWNQVCDFIKISKAYSYKLAKAYFLSFDEFSFEHLESVYMGKYDSESDFAQTYLEDTGQLSSIPENLRNYFDYDSFARDLFLTDFSYDNGFVFINI